LERLRCLDGLRGVLAVYVMASHMAPFAVLPHWLASLLSHGGAGVDAFFVLSGLVIVQSLAAHDYRRGRFLAARAARIFPVFLPVFAFAVAVQALDGLADGGVWDALPWIGPDSPARSIWSIGWPHDWAAVIGAHLTMTHGIFPDAVLPDIWVGFLGAAWSLSTEWQFYALAALAAPWLRRGALTLPGFAGLLLVLAACGAAWQAVAPVGWGFSRAFLPNKAAYFALGVASVPLTLTPALSRDAEEGAPLLVFAAVLAATLLLCLLQGVDKLAIPLVWAGVLAAQVLPRRTHMGWAAWLLTRRAVLWLGAISYPLYLVNEPVQKLLGRALAAVVRGDGVLFSAVWIPAALVVPVGLGWLLHVWVERPAMRRLRGPRVAAPPRDTLCAGPKWTNPTRLAGSRIRMSRSRTG
jgi:peptidoglycan/LPS O-acetylase OafA/YrhL